MNNRWQSFISELTVLSSTKFLFLTVILALLLRLWTVAEYLPLNKYYDYAYGTHDTRMPIADDHRYIEIAMNFLNGNGFPKISEQPPFDYDLRRGPLYSLFLSGVFFFFGFQILFVILLQSIISAASIPFIYKIALHYYDEKTARLASGVWAVFPPSILWAHAILRETLTAFFIVAAVWSLLYMIKRPCVQRIFLSGFLSGLLLLQDPFAVTILPVCIGFIFMHDFTAQFHNEKIKSIHKRAILISAALFRTLKNNFRVKVFRATGWSAVVLIVILPWLYWTRATLGRPALGTASVYGLWNDWFIYYKYKTLKKNNPYYTQDDFEKYLLQYRYEIGKPYIAGIGSADSVSDATKASLIFNLRYNADYIGELNHHNMMNTMELLKNDPSLYFGIPFGKLMAVKFFDYWLNFAVSYPPKEMPNISSLYAWKTGSGMVVTGFALMSLLLSPFLFWIYLRHCTHTGLITFVWLVYFLFYNIIKFRAEARYTLPVHAFAIIVLCGAVSKLLQIKNQPVD